MKERPKNTFRRFEKRPAPVHKLGHFGMCVTNYAKCYEFYSTFFNFYPSEVRITSYHYHKLSITADTGNSWFIMTRAWT